MDATEQSRPNYMGIVVVICRLPEWVAAHVKNKEFHLPRLMLRLRHNINKRVRGRYVGFVAGTRPLASGYKISGN